MPRMVRGLTCRTRGAKLRVLFFSLTLRDGCGGGRIMIFGAYKEKQHSHMSNNETNRKSVYKSCMEVSKCPYLNCYAASIIQRNFHFHNRNAYFLMIYTQIFAKNIFNSFVL